MGALLTQRDEFLRTSEAQALALLDDPNLSRRLGSKRTDSFRERIEKMLSTLK